VLYLYRGLALHDRLSRSSKTYLSGCAMLNVPCLLLLAPALSDT
jgi:hypothetical protein